VTALPDAPADGQSPASVAEPAPLTRVVVFVGDGTEMDFVLPAKVQLIVIVEDLLDSINKKLTRRRQPTLELGPTYLLCRADTQPLNPQHTLDEAGVLDGDALWLLPSEVTEQFEPVIEDVSTAIAREAEKRLSRTDHDTPRQVACVLGAGLVTWAELMLVRLWWHSGGWVPATVSWVVMVSLVAASWAAAHARDRHRRAAADAFARIAVVPFAGALALSIPGHPSSWHAVAALVGAVCAAVVLGIWTDRHLTAIAAIGVIGVATAAVMVVHGSGWHVRPERVALVALLIVLILVTFASNTMVIASGVPGPWFPSLTGRGVFERRPGSPRDTVSPVYPAGTETPEQIAGWVRRGNAVATGVLLGCSVVLVVATRYAVIPGRPYALWYLLFTLAIATIVLLRARAFADRWQSIILTVAPVVAFAVVLGRYAAASTPPDLTVTLICVAATLGVAAVGLVVALVVVTAKVNAPMRRIVEFAEYVLLLPIVPVAAWLLGLVSVFRNLLGGA
jgi:type VII secretion integral membrane protein EccD